MSEGDTGERHEDDRVNFPLTPHDLYRKYSPSVVRIVTQAPGGEPSAGTGFHIGDGWVVTARHVLEKRRIVEVGATGYARFEAIADVLYPDNARVDLALCKTDFSLEHYMTRTTVVGLPPELKVDHIPLGTHLNDWLGEELLATRALVMGYPTVPGTLDSRLVARPCSVTSVVDPYLTEDHQPYFLTSDEPRGGLSGGPLLSEYDFLLGVRLLSLQEGALPLELGYAASLSVEEVWQLLFQNRVFPASNRVTAAMLRNAWGLELGDFDLSDPELEEIATLEQAER